MTTVKLPKRDANGRFSSSSKKQTKKPLGHRMTAHKIAQRVSRYKPAKPTTSKLPKPKKALNHVGLVVDCSGSMQGCWSAVRQELKRTVNTVRGESIRTGQETTLSVIAFGDYVQEVLAGVQIKDAAFPEHLLPNMGYTALFDAVAQMVDTLNRLPNSNEASMVVIVITDGDENHSRFTTAPQLRGKIDLKQKTDRWSFAFLVPPNHKQRITQGLGLPEGNVIEWENTDQGSRAAGQSITRGISSYYDVRSRGHASTTGFFTSNAAKVSSTAVKDNLDEISREVKIWQVPREVAIREFVEDKIGSYTLGKAFYQLTKDELIEYDKDLMIVPKGEKTVFIGAKVRDLLKLPKTENVKVRPGNHGNWDIFVQSRSVNRKLVRGTKLIYRV